MVHMPLPVALQYSESLYACILTVIAYHCAAAAVAGLVSEKLGVSRLLMEGVENETVMVEMLSALKEATTPGCFMQGAGVLRKVMWATDVQQGSCMLPRKLCF